LANGVTIRYTGTEQAVSNAWNQSTPKPLFILEDPKNTGTPEWFAVVFFTTANPKISEYAKSAGSAVSTFFTPPGETEPVPFNNIVTSLVDNMSALFNNAITFNKSVRSWDTSKVYTMDYMFAGANAFNQDVSSFDTSNVQNMEGMFSMGGLDPQFNNAGLPGIGSWNTSKVATMKVMFQNARNFNQNLRGWDVSKVTEKTNMFSSAQRMLPYNYPQNFPTPF
jgi:surface protein